MTCWQRSAGSVRPAGLYLRLVAGGGGVALGGADRYVLARAGGPGAAEIPITYRRRPASGSADVVERLAGRVRLALEAADLDAYAELLDPGVRWGPPGDPVPPCQNRAQVLAWYQRGRCPRPCDRDAGVGEPDPGRPEGDRPPGHRRGD